MQIKTRRDILIFLALVTVCLAIYWCARLPGYDPSRVDARLLSLRQPYKLIRCVNYLDGGSTGIEIVDASGQIEQFAIPAHLGDSNRYGKIFVGALSDRKPEAVEIVAPDNTKRMLVSILATYDQRNQEDDLCLFKLGRRPIDAVRVLVHRWKGDYNP